MPKDIIYTANGLKAHPVQWLSAMCARGEPGTALTPAQGLSDLTHMHDQCPPWLVGAPGRPVACVQALTACKLTIHVQQQDRFMMVKCSPAS